MEPDGVTFWHSPLLQGLQSAQHGFTTRQGGVSQAGFAELNLSSHVGDLREHVHENRRRVLQALGRQKARWVGLRQEHGDTIVEVTRNAANHLVADGLWSRDRQVVLAVTAADCVPILFADVQARGVAAVHAGWRGIRAGIAAAMVRRLGDQGIPVADLRVALGPAIGPCCFAVGPEVESALAGIAPAAAAAIVRRGEQTFADLWHLGFLGLTEAGVPAAQIDVLRRCTRCDARLFSRRRAVAEGTAYGNHAGIIALPR